MREWGVGVGWLSIVLVECGMQGLLSINMMVTMAVIIIIIA